MVTIVAVLIGGALSATVVMLLYVLRMMDDRIKRLENRLENSIRLSDGFAGGVAIDFISGDQVDRMLRPFLEIVLRTLAILEKRLRGKQNPVTEGEMRKLRDYLNRTASQKILTRDEFQEFQSLLQRVSSHLPEAQRDEFSGAASMLRRFAAGLALASRIK